MSGASGETAKNRKFRATFRRGLLKIAARLSKIGGVGGRQRERRSISTTSELILSLILIEKEKQ